MQFNVLEAKNQLSKLIESAMSGDDVVIARRGKPAVRLVPVEDSHPKGSGAAFAELFASWGPLPHRSAAEIEDELREIKDGWPERE